MRKILLGAVVSLLMLLPLSATPEPLVILSMAAPAVTALDSDEGHVDYSASLSSDMLMSLAVPAEVKDSGVTLSGLLSDNLITMGMNMFDAALMISNFDNSEVINACGSMDMILDEESIQNGYLSADLTFNDADILYRFGSGVTRATLNGTLRLSLAFFEEPLLSLFIDTGDMVVSGDDSYVGNVLELRLELNRELVDAYMEMTGAGIESSRQEALWFIASQSGMYDEMVLGADLSSMDYDTVITVLDECNLLDVLDAVAFFLTAVNDLSLDLQDMIIMAIKPSIYVNGEPVEDLDLSKGLRRVADIYSLISAF